MCLDCEQRSCKCLEWEAELREMEGREAESFAEFAEILDLRAEGPLGLLLRPRS